MGVSRSVAYHARNRDKEAQIVALYQSGKSVARIIPIVGLGKKAIDNALARNGVRKRTVRDNCPRSSGKEKEIISVYQSGISAAETGKRFGVCEATVIYVLRKNSVPVRRVGIHDVTKSPNWKGGVSKDKDYQKKRKNTYRAKRKSIDPLYKLGFTLRARIGSFFKRSTLCQIKKIYKKNTSLELLGASIGVVLFHIESQFQPGMTWKNYGQKGWHVDHRIPLCSAKNEGELKALFHYTNLRPLWATDNHKKGGKIVWE